MPLAHVTTGGTYTAAARPVSQGGCRRAAAKQADGLPVAGARSPSPWGLDQEPAQLIGIACGGQFFHRRIAVAFRPHRPKLRQPRQPRPGSAVAPCSEGSGYVPVLRPHVDRGHGNGQYGDDERASPGVESDEEVRRFRVGAGNPTDSRAGNGMWMLFVGGRAYAGRNGDLQESC